MKLSISLDPEEVKILNKRAKKNFLSLTEQIEDIIRRSCISYSKRNNLPKLNCDDKLVGIFSRQKSGRKKKK
jgi:hypothetical protein